MQDPLRPPAVLAVLGALTLITSYLWKPGLAPRYVGLSNLTLPARAGELALARELPVDPLVRAALPTADIRQCEYRAASGESVQLTLIAGRDRDSLHDPRSCMVGAGWRIEDDRVEPLAGAGISLRRCTMAQADQRYEALYGYVLGGEVLAEPTQIRARMLATAVLGRKDRPVCFFRLVRRAERLPQKTFDQFSASLWRELNLERRF
jgi:hypothetical protein